MDISFKAKGEELGIVFGELAEEVIAEMQLAVAQAARLTYNRAIELAGQRLHSTRQEYISHLHLEEEGDGVYVVYLDEEADYLEEGQPPHAQLPRLAQGPKSKQTKDGTHRYTIIPLRQTTAPVNPTSPVQTEMSANLRQAIRSGQFKTIRQGRGASGKFTTVERIAKDAAVHPYIKGLVRVREYGGVTQEALTGGGTKGMPLLSSSYFTFRIASENQDPIENWFHPGSAGAHIWDDLEQWADQQVEQIIREIAFQD